MKRVIWSNVLLFINGLLFYGFNNMFYQFIYFNPAQPLFRQEHYLYISLIELLIFLSICFLLKKMYKRNDHEDEKKLLVFEYKIFFILAFLSTIVYMFYTFYPNYPNPSIIYPLLYRPHLYIKYIWFYLFEAMVILFIGSRFVIKRTILEYVHIYLSLPILFISLLTPVYIYNQIGSMSVVEANILKEFFYVFVLFPVALVAYYVQNNKKTQMIIDGFIMIMVITIILIQKTPYHYYFMDIVYVLAKPYVAYYLWGLILIITSFDIFRLRKGLKDLEISID